MNGGLCPYANASSPSFSQTSYETCMVNENVSQCIVPLPASLSAQFQRYIPAYYSVPSSFHNHEVS